MPKKKAAIGTILLIAGLSLGSQSLLEPASPVPPFPPPGARVQAYRVAAIRGSLSDLDPPPAGTAASPSLDPSIRDELRIEGEEQYRSVLGAPSEGIDWRVSRIFVFEEMAVYKLGALDSATSLDGVYRSDKAIVIGRRFTMYGPVQGIAQLPEWFSYRYRFLFLLVPREPEAIQILDLGLEDIPNDIP